MVGQSCGYLITLLFGWLVSLIVGGWSLVVGCLLVVGSLCFVRWWMLVVCCLFSGCRCSFIPVVCMLLFDCVVGRCFALVDCCEVCVLFVVCYLRLLLDVCCLFVACCLFRGIVVS